MKYRDFEDYRVEITPVMESSFEDDSWFFSVDIYCNGYGLTRETEICSLNLLANSMSDAMMRVESIIHRDMRGAALPPKLSELNYHLANWIRNCWQSQNDMWYVDLDDEELKEIDEDEWKIIEDQVDDYFGTSVEIFNPYTSSGIDDYVVCCYGASINYVNWLNDQQDYANMLKEQGITND